MPTTTVAAIERQLDFRASPERLWRALTDEHELVAWFGHRASLDLRVGGEGWWRWEIGNFAYRVEAVEPPRYLCWTWAATADTPLDAAEVLRTEWVLVPRVDGGTDLHLLETGFRRAASASENAGG